MMHRAPCTIEASVRWILLGGMKHTLQSAQCTAVNIRLHNMACGSPCDDSLWGLLRAVAGTWERVKWKEKLFLD